MRKLALLLLVGLTLLPHARAEEVPEGANHLVIFPQRQKERRASRWTLADWLSTKEKIRQQNLWLERHTHKVPVDVTYAIQAESGRMRHELEAFLLWLGLRLRGEHNAGLLGSTRAGGLDNLSGGIDLQFRLLGGNPQNTNLVIRGLWDYDDLRAPSNLRGFYTGFGIGAKLQIYFIQWLGVWMSYDFRFARQNLLDINQKMQGGLVNAAAFLELGAVRAEVGYRNRGWHFSGPSPTDFGDSTFFLGMRLHF